MRSSASARIQQVVSGSVESIPWRGIGLDLVLVVGWILVVSFAFRQIGWPTWLYYAVTFGGVIVYSLTTDPWRRWREH